MKKKIGFFVAGILFLALTSVFAQDMTIDSNGYVGIGTTSPDAKLEVVGETDGEALVGSSSGTGVGVYGTNDTSGNYGFIGDNTYGIFGYSSDGYAGYFQGDARITGKLTVDGVLTGTGIADITSVNAGSGLSGGGVSGDVSLDIEFAGTGSSDTASRSDHNHNSDYSLFLHVHDGNDITSGMISEVFIDPIITRDTEIMPTVLINDGSGSGLNADFLDGQDASAFAGSIHLHDDIYYETGHVDTLENRIDTLEGQEAKTFIIRSAAAAADETYTSDPELKSWIKAAQKAGTREGPLTYLDTNGNGVVKAGSDLTNDGIAASGVATTFVNARMFMMQTSPWNDTLLLWVNGSAVQSQAACSATATGNPGQITLCFAPSEDNNIQALFVSAVDDTGNIIYEKSVNGHTEEERIDAVIESANDAGPELEFWIKAAQKTGTSEGSLKEVDSNGDGVIDANDMPNDILAANGVVTTFVNARVNMWQSSPWDGFNSLWVDGSATQSQAACSAAATGYPGQITLCYTPNQNQDIQTVFISIADYAGNIIYQKSVSGRTERERIDSVIESANDAVLDIESWIKAAQKAGTSEGMLKEVDSNGDGIIDANDKPNDILAANGVVTTFVNARVNMWQSSPWDGFNSLWIEGGISTNQNNCSSVALSYPGQITLCYSPIQDQHIQAVFIAAADYTGNIIYQKSVSGRTERERIDSVIESANDAVLDIESWIKAAQKADAVIEIDTNGDGAVDGNDLPNEMLAASGVVTTFVQARINKWQSSPWDGFNALWVDAGAVSNQYDCDYLKAQPNPGQITLCFTPEQDQNIQVVFMSAVNNAGIVFYSKSVSGN